MSERTATQFARHAGWIAQRDGVSRAEIGRRIGTTRGHACEMLNGRRNITARTMDRIAKALGCRVVMHLEPAGDHPTESPEVPSDG